MATANWYYSEFRDQGEARDQMFMRENEDIFYSYEGRPKTA